VAATLGLVALLDAGLVVGISQIRPSIGRVDAVIVLGAAVGTPALRERTMTVMAALQSARSNTLVLSGGQGPTERVPEAAAMLEVVAEQSLPDSIHILLESTSSTTYENIQNSKHLIPEAKRVLIVSDEFHLARAVLLAKRAGFQYVAWDAPAPSYYPKRELAGYYAREMVAMIAYIPKFIFN
jgi:uncharacterized SAM-binding protein YcdF (DUF218 family)